MNTPFRVCDSLYPELGTSSRCSPLLYFPALVVSLYAPCECALQGGWTALIRAAVNGQADCARLLIDAGADKEAKTNVRRASVLISLLFLHFNFSQQLFVLFAFSLPVSIHKFRFDFLLFLHVNRNFLFSVMPCLSRGGIDSQSGSTALIIAAANASADCARLLIDAGTDKDVRNNVLCFISCFCLHSTFVLSAIFVRLFHCRLVLMEFFSRTRHCL
jgi:hypothetical protein